LALPWHSAGSASCSLEGHSAVLSTYSSPKYGVKKKRNSVRDNLKNLKTGLDLPEVLEHLRVMQDQYHHPTSEEDPVSLRLSAAPLHSISHRQQKKSPSPVASRPASAPPSTHDSDDSYKQNRGKKEMFRLHPVHPSASPPVRSPRPSSRQSIVTSEKGSPAEPEEDVERKKGEGEGEVENPTPERRKTRVKRRVKVRRSTLSPSQQRSKSQPVPETDE